MKIAICLLALGCAARATPITDAGALDFMRDSDGGIVGGNRVLFDYVDAGRRGWVTLIADAGTWDDGGLPDTVFQQLSDGGYFFHGNENVQTLAQAYAWPETKFVVWDQETNREALVIDRHGKLTLEEPVNPAARAFVKAVHRMWELEDRRRPLCR